MIEIKTIESQYEKLLAFHYGDICSLINALRKSINLYKNCKNPNHEKVKCRIAKYKKIIEYAEQKPRRYKEGSRA